MSADTQSMPYKVKKSGKKFCVVKSTDGKQIACHDTRPKALAQLKALYANEKAALDTAEIVPYAVPCLHDDCARLFINFDKMVDHADGPSHLQEKTWERAEALLTFDDTRKIVHEYIREKFGRTGTYQTTPPIPSIWTWIEDMAVDWVVYTVEEANETTLFRASYSITDGSVTLGDGVEVRRRTVYDPV